MSNAPLHKVISDWIRGEISASRLKVDDKLPSENELAHQFDVSRLTVRRALQTLEQDQLIFRSQGLGAFVKAPMPKKKLLNLNSFNEDLTDSGMNPSSKVLQKIIATPPDHVRVILGLDTQKKVVQLDRLRLGDSRAFAFDRTWLPVFYGQLIDDKDLSTTSIYDILENEYNIPILKGCNRFDAANADAHIATHLGVAENTALLLIRRISYTTGNKIVFYQERYLRTDRFVYEMQLERNNWAQNEVNATNFAPIFDPKMDLFELV